MTEINGHRVNKYKRINQIKHPKENEKYTTFHLFTGPCEPDEYVSLTQKDIEQIKNNDHTLELQTNTGEYYMPDIKQGHLVGLYY